MLILECSLLPSPPGLWILPKSTLSDLPGLPTVDAKGDCNCTRGHYGHIICRYNMTQPPVSSLPAMSQRNNSDTEGSQSSDSDHDSFSITVKCKGCSYDQYQGPLKELRRKGSAMHQVKLRLQREPDNEQDKNAICIQAELGTWQTIGYIGKEDIPRVTQALRNYDITVSLLRIRSQFRPTYNVNVLLCWVTLTKMGPWGPKSSGYAYNQD